MIMWRNILLLFYYSVGESPEFPDETELFTASSVTQSSRPELFVVSMRPAESERDIGKKAGENNV